MTDEHLVPEEILDEMAAYYRARASEYTAWFARREPGARGCRKTRTGSQRSALSSRL